MAKRKTDGRYTTTRVVYKEVKRYDHAQFDDFCTKIYQQGIKEGQAAATSRVDLAAVMAQVQTVKGIGEKRLEQIAAAVGTLFEGKEGG